MKNFPLPLLLIVSLIWLGCASPRAVEMTQADASEAPATEEAAASTETADATPTESSISIDAKTNQISGKAAIAMLRPYGDEVAFTKEKQGVDALIKAINNNTQIECKLQKIVSHVELANLQVPLLIVTAGEGLKEAKVLDALKQYVDRGGVVLIDGSWQGNIISSGTRITPRSSHPLLTEPYNLGESRQRRFRPIEAIQVGKRLGIIITNQSYASFWSGSSGTEHTWATRLGINILVYALKTSTWSQKEETGQGTPTRPGGVSPTDLAPI